MKTRKVKHDGRRWLSPWHFAVFAMGAVVGSVLGEATSSGIPVVVIAGQVTPEAADAARAAGASVVSLTERFGAERAVGDTVRCIEQAVAEFLSSNGTGQGAGDRA